MTEGAKQTLETIQPWFHELAGPSNEAPEPLKEWYHEEFPDSSLEATMIHAEIRPLGKIKNIEERIRELNNISDYVLSVLSNFPVGSDVSVGPKSDWLDTFSELYHYLIDIRTFVSFNTERLEQLGLRINEDGKLANLKGKKHYFNSVVVDLYKKLRPAYIELTGDDKENPQGLREWIAWALNCYNWATNLIDASNRERWTPFFGQFGDRFKVDSQCLIMPPFSQCIPPAGSCRL